MSRKDVKGGDCDQWGGAILPGGKTGSSQLHVKPVESSVPCVLQLWAGFCALGLTMNDG